MTKAQSQAYRFRHLLLIGGILYCAAAIVWIVLPLLPGVNEALFGEGFGSAGLLWTPLGVLADDEWWYGLNVALVVGLLLLGQWALLRPGRGLSVRLTMAGRPLRSAVASAAVMASLLTFGSISLLLELPDWWVPGIESAWDWLAPGTHRAEGPCGWPWAVLCAAVFVLLWAFWAWLFFLYWRQGDRYTQLGKMLRALIGGSLLEALVAVPAHVWAVRQRECYCARGTYTTLVLAGAVLFWAFGPGIILLYMREKYRRAMLFPTCEKCGYDLRGNVSNVCPECGTKLDHQ